MRGDKSEGNVSIVNEKWLEWAEPFLLWCLSAQLACLLLALLLSMQLVTNYSSKVSFLTSNELVKSPSLDV